MQMPGGNSYRPAAIFLDAVNAASMGLMGAIVLKFSYPVVFQLNESMMPVGIEWISLLILLGASVASLRYRVSPALLVLAGALVGLVQLGLGV